MRIPKFRAYEKVRIVSNRPQAKDVRGELGAITAFCETDDGEFTGAYGVWVYSDDYLWMFEEDELESTGEFDREENFITDLTLGVDPNGQPIPPEDDAWADFPVREPRFALYEKVRVDHPDPDRRELDGEVGAVIHIARTVSGRFTGVYALHMYRRQETWCCEEEELESLGQFDRAENFPWLSPEDPSAHDDSEPA